MKDRRKGTPVSQQTINILNLFEQEQSNFWKYPDLQVSDHYVCTDSNNNSV